MPNNYIKRIGLELEGGWRSRPGWELRRDGSVEVRAEYVGELSSPPYSKPENAEGWLRRFHPGIVNNTCGFHIHISLDPGHYSRLMCQEFLTAFKEAYKAWGEEKFRASMLSDNAVRFFDRLNGQNRYCIDRYAPDEQTQVTTRQNPIWESRYAQLNFCWSLHGTLESRLLPMFSDVNLSASAMHVFLNLVNSWLETNLAQPETPLTLEVNEDSELNLGPEMVRLPEVPVIAIEPAVQTQAAENYQQFLETVLPGMFLRGRPRPRRSAPGGWVISNNPDPADQVF